MLDLFHPTDASLSREVVPFGQTHRNKQPGPSEDGSLPAFDTEIVALPAPWMSETPGQFFNRTEAEWAHYAFQRIFLATNAECTTGALETLQSRQGWQELFGNTNETPPTLWDLLAKTSLRRQTAEQMEAEITRNLFLDKGWNEHTISTQIARAQAWFCQVARFFGENTRSDPMRNPHTLVFLHALWEINEDLSIGG